jgi:hypothetical protein
MVSGGFVDRETMSRVVNKEIEFRLKWKPEELEARGNYALGRALG